jgi:hypothetical protein
VLHNKRRKAFAGYPTFLAWLKDVCRVLLVLPLNPTTSFPVPATSETPSITASEPKWIDVDVYFPTPVTLAQMADEQRAFLATVTERFATFLSP